MVGIVEIVGEDMELCEECIENFKFFLFGFYLEIVLCVLEGEVKFWVGLCLMSVDGKFFIGEMCVKGFWFLIGYGYLGWM